MKTTITLTKSEAQERLAMKMLDDLPYSDNEVVVKIEDEPRAAKLSDTSLISLIKMVRTLGDEILQSRIKSATDQVGNRYIGLGDAKQFVEDYIRNNPTQ